ncbi:hypothetical protein EXS71_01110 [Candidatus Uhrbacteria bacterium]|nr:hypothetical protein [Candidatus Uhrbacteria bacterium]
MLGVPFAILGTLFEEVSTSIGKSAVKKRQESVYAMGFLDMIWGAVFFLILALFFHNGPLTIMSWWTLGLRLVLEIFQAYFVLEAIAKCDRSTFGFVRVGTIPILLIVDTLLGYTISPIHLIGIGLICASLLFLFMNHGINRRGLGYLILATIGSAITISLYKYNISHGNSLELEQFIASLVLVIFFYIMSRFREHEKPFQLLLKPRFSLQAATMGVGNILCSFAYIFAPASIITSVTRSSTIVFALISGRAYFHERHVAIKFFGLIGCVAGIVLLTIR